jgi:hypothetical protein
MTLSTLRSKFLKIDWIFISTLPVFLWLISDRWMFLSVQYWFDPWGFLGMYLDYEYLSSLNQSYGMTRLPSIILHFFAYKFFDTYWAVVTTTLLKFYLCIIPLYWSLCELTKNRFTSLISVFLLSFFPYFLSSLGWNYVDGFGIAFISLATAFLIAACTKENWRLWLFLAGFCQAYMVFNYLFVVVFALVQVMVFIAYNQTHEKKPLFPCSLFFGMGAFFATASLSSFSYYFNGTILFFWPQIEAALHLTSLAHVVSGKDSVWYMPFNQWVRKSTFLFLTVFSLILSIFYFAERFKAFRQNLTDIFSLPNLIILQFLVTFAIYVAQDCLGLHMLQNFFVACYLLPFAVLTLGIILSEKMPSFRYENWIALGIVTIFYMFFSLKGNAAVVGRSWGCVIVHFMGCLILSSLFFKASQRQHKISYLILTGFCMLFAFNRLTLNKNDYPYQDHADNKLLVSLHRHIKNHIPSEGLYLFWYDVAGDQLSSFFQPLACTYLGGLFSSHFPEIAESHLGSKATIILLSSDPNAVSKAEKTLNQKGHTWHILSQEKYHLGDKEFLMLAFVLKPKKK